MLPESVHPEFTLRTGVHSGPAPRALLPGALNGRPVRDDNDLFTTGGQSAQHAERLAVRRDVGKRHTELR
jgi:hypothetical protein